MQEHTREQRTAIYIHEKVPVATNSMAKGQVFPHASRPFSDHVNPSTDSIDTY